MGRGPWGDDEGVKGRDPPTREPLGTSTGNLTLPARARGGVPNFIFMAP